MTRIIDHVGLKVGDFERSKAFRSETLATLGIERLADMTCGRGHHSGFDKGPHPSFRISNRKATRGDTHGAFVFDPDGHNIEVACHGAE